MLSFAVAIFVGAFLLFQVQPLIGKYILPWFGGTPAVWTSCMLFFQLVLVGGYAYAHVSARRLSPRQQAAVHLLLLLLAVELLPITPSESWKPQDSSHPAWRITALLAASIGLPYFVLSATGPLLQEWYRRMYQGRSPFRLYALSNLGSLLALVSYPFWFEVHCSRQTQATAWSWGMMLFVVVCGYCAARVLRANSVTPTVLPATNDTDPPAPGSGRRLLWLALPACASVLLLAVTNKLCQDVAVIPFLWVLPLSLYLLTFIISFDSPRWYSRVVFGAALVPAFGAATWALFMGGDVPIIQQVVIYGSALFVGGMMCHGELYRLRPTPRFLTSFYLMIAVGGALGGVFVAILAPLLFDTYAELHWGMGVCLLLFLLVCATGRDALGTVGWRVLTVLYVLAACAGLDRAVAWATGWLKDNHSELGWGLLARVDWGWAEKFHWLVWIGLAVLVARALLKKELAAPRNWHRGACALLALALAVLTVALAGQSWQARHGALSMTRNFYGVLSVWEYERDRPEYHYLLLQHGRITHGLQLVDPASSFLPVTYYGPNSGVGLAFNHFPRQESRAIAVVGLGTGTLAVYGKEGDWLRFYEINPEVERLARERFTYLEQCPAYVEVLLGDARLSLEREPPQHFDLLALDAFNSDAIPVHLLTREAFEIYLRHLKPDGVIAVHISNCYLDLEPVVENLAAHFRLQRASISEDEPTEDDGEGWWRYASTWVLLSRNQALFDHPDLRAAQSQPKARSKKLPLWTDDYASLLSILE